MLIGIYPIFAQQTPENTLLEKEIPELKATIVEKSQVKQPISINADTVEYSADSKNVTATGNVEIIYAGAKLICQEITINTETKDGNAEGHVRLDDEKGVIEAEKMTYNFQTKAGVMIDAKFRANPYFGKAERINKVDEAVFVAMRARMSTCNFDDPHYFIKTRRVDFVRGEKMMAKDNLIMLGQNEHLPIMYLPQFNRSFKKPFMHVQVTPGTKKDWGYYLLSAWQYTINDYIDGNILLDYRANFGVAEGFETYYRFPDFGKGDFKLYYTQERDSSKDLSNAPNTARIFERYLIRWRHKWDVTPNTNVISEYYRIEDSKRMVAGTKFNLLKDYFYREYEKDVQPLSYVQIHHLFSNSSLDFVVQPRVNRWYSQLEKLPELKYTLASSQIPKTPVYFENLSSLANYNTVSGLPPVLGAPQPNMTRFDTYNIFSYPTRVSIFRVAPFVANRSTYYNLNINGSSIAPRTIFYSGADVSTKLYKIYNVKTGWLGLDINGLRHIITPSAAYGFNNKPTILSSQLRQIDAIDSIAAGNAVTFELQNKLQTKRNGQAVDLVDFRIDNSYTFRSSSNKSGGTLSDFLLYLNVLPYSWLSFYSDSTFSRLDHKFTIVNADMSISLGPERSVGIGERYVRGGSKETTFSFNWRINPKWKFNVYERYQFGNAPDLSKGIREQQYSLQRDLHCWITEFTLDLDKVKGNSVWVIFRLKAFPELQFDFNQNYHEPKPGSQTSS